MFDHELVARAIAAASVPVLTGLGHEIDRLVADDVAHRSLKTPTACAGAPSKLTAARDPLGRWPGRRSWRWRAVGWSVPNAGSTTSTPAGGRTPYAVDLGDRPGLIEMQRALQRSFAPGTHQPPGPHRACCWPTSRRFPAPPAHSAPILDGIEA